MRKLKILKTAFKATIFYSLIRLLVLIIFRIADLYDFLHFHYSNDLAWIFLTIIFPLSTAILIALKVKSKFLTDLGKFFLPLLIIVTITGYGFNKSYWGHIIKRPSVFSELKDATEILSITEANKDFNSSKFEISKDTIKYYDHDYFLDLYYKNFERPFMQFGALGQRGNLYQYKDIAENSNLKLLKEELKVVETLILNSGFLVKPDESYEEYGNQLNIQIIEFTTSGEQGYLISKSIEDRKKPLFDYDSKYLFVTINSGQLENDHYPIYEFLIEDNEIVKKQKYFYDLAGIEGAEYSLLAPIAETTILILSLILFGIYKLIIKLRKNWLQHRI
ncbi:hypothetical protein [Ulvibacter litoralis]|uniref:Uncharacterized protein n=1 Tax=Ulvibacter litoralis TaxID=227084 RepID=A0A1G7K337_9FLAO|nr:hypothetical protein [Ulvibacter litoralis]GHC66429.1 hypothetical protein GCM10008083_34160 [Ulvibacter litoralis]SDF31444.1 hypothetical protein SAMN05421855_1482 [Ulvibacter litoralis]